MWRYYYWQWKDSVEDYSKTIDMRFLKKYWYLDKWAYYKKQRLYRKINWEDNWNILVEVNKCEGNELVEVNKYEGNELVELEVFIDILNNAKNYYKKASYVQKRKIAKVLFSNIKINTKKELVIQIKPELQTLFNPIWWSL